MVIQILSYLIILFYDLVSFISVTVHEVMLLSIFELYVAAFLKEASGAFLQEHNSVLDIVNELIKSLSEDDNKMIQEIHKLLALKLEDVKKYTTATE